jgi:hypothetical protein
MVSPYWLDFQEYPVKDIPMKSVRWVSWRRECQLASTKGQASDANAIQATSDNIEALWDEVIIDIGPGKPSPDLDRPRVFTDDNLLEPRHGYVYAAGWRKAAIDSMTTTFDRERHAIKIDLLKL